MWWVSSWAGYWLTIPLGSALSPVPALLVDRINFGLKMLWVGWCLYNSTGFLSHYRRWPFQVPYPQCSESQLRSPPLILRCFLYPRFLSHPGDAPQPTSSPHMLQIPIHFHVHLAISPDLSHTWFGIPQPPPHPSSLPVLSYHLLLLTILDPLLSEILTSSLAAGLIGCLHVEEWK